MLHADEVLARNVSTVRVLFTRRRDDFTKLLNVRLLLVLFLCLFLSLRPFQLYFIP